MQEWDFQDEDHIQGSTSELTKQLSAVGFKLDTNDIVAQCAIWDAENIEAKRKRDEDPIRSFYYTPGDENVTPDYEIYLDQVNEIQTPKIKSEYLSSFIMENSSTPQGILDEYLNSSHVFSNHKTKYVPTNFQSDIGYTPASFLEYGRAALKALDLEVERLTQEAEILRNDPENEDEYKKIMFTLKSIRATQPFIYEEGFIVNYSFGYCEKFEIKLSLGDIPKAIKEQEFFYLNLTFHDPENKFNFRFKKLDCPEPSRLMILEVRYLVNKLPNHSMSQILELFTENCEIEVLKLEESKVKIIDPQNEAINPVREFYALVERISDEFPKKYHKGTKSSCIIIINNAMVYSRLKK